MNYVKNIPSQGDIELVEGIIRGTRDLESVLRETGYSPERVEAWVERFLTAGRRVLDAGPARPGRTMLARATPAQTFCEDGGDAWLGPRRLKTLDGHLDSFPEDELRVVRDWLAEAARHSHDALLAWFSLWPLLEAFSAACRAERDDSAQQAVALARATYALLRRHRLGQFGAPIDEREGARSDRSFTHARVRELGEKLNAIFNRQNRESTQNSETAAAIAVDGLAGLSIQMDCDSGWRGFSSGNDLAAVLAERVFQLAGECLGDIGRRHLQFDAAERIAADLVRPKSPISPVRAAVLLAIEMDLYEASNNNRDDFKNDVDSLVKAVFDSTGRLSKRAGAVVAER